MPKKTTRRARTKNTSSSSRSFLDYIRSGESYTSLILGIVVVIIASILLISFFRNRGEQPRQTPEIASQNTVNEDLPLTVTPGDTTPIVEVTRTEQQIPTPTVTVEPTVSPTVVERRIPSPTEQPAQITQPSGRTYTVKAGETLWSIAQSQYKSGYNWVDIAKVNNITHPDQISAGMKLSLPEVKQIAVATPTPTVVITNKITAESYKVAEGDYLWDIALRRYGDGYKWVEIARVNNIQTPDVIQPGAVFKLPKL